MIKTLTLSTLALTANAVAFAAPLPAPPTEVYTPHATANCDGETLQLYFPSGTSALTPASRAILEAAQARLKNCVLGQVSLNASAADARNQTEAATLTSARIETVSAALDDYALTGMKVSADNKVYDRPDALWSPMDRKVEVQLVAWSPEIS